VRAFVTGAKGGLGRAFTARLVEDGYDVDGADLPEFDVTRPESWGSLAAYDVLFLNAGVTTATGGDVLELTDDAYRQAVGVNVDGVVYGVRAAGRSGMKGAIVVTASLAGLMEVEGDPVYALTKHALVGFVRSVAPQLERRGIRINAVCPGLVDTPMVDAMRPFLGDFPLIPPADVAEAAMRAIRGGRCGEAWIVQPGIPGERYRFRGVPGPRTAGAEGLAPPMPT
jgi:NAD(P)-dependent dehydrogenase (short-subunit alcohol dehydrogenase family)